MTEIVTPLILFIIGIITGFVDSTVGAGGLVAVPSLLFMGYPAHTAVATDRFGAVGQLFTAFFKFRKANKIVWEYVPIFTAFSLVGALLGVYILLSINPDALKRIIGAILLFLLPVILYNKDTGVKRVKATKSKRILGMIVYFIIMIYGGLIGQGTGPLLFYALLYFLGFTMIEVIATNVVPWMVISLFSLIIFAFNGMIDYQAGIILLIGTAIGGYLGAHVALKKGELWVKRLFVLFVIVSGIKLLFF